MIEWLSTSDAACGSRLNREASDRDAEVDVTVADIYYQLRSENDLRFIVLICSFYARLPVESAVWLCVGKSHKLP